MLENQVHVSAPAWSGKVLIAAAIHCAAWGLFILALPAKSAVVYGFAEPPVDLFLWQGTGLMILLFGIGYGIA
ncbi:MAG: hypothetical protein KDA85_22865, partial [Planctomycetaceae bacterium]|nr:hypothetical protein [Planctomycetaceae bacterium]